MKVLVLEGKDVSTKLVWILSELTSSKRIGGRTYTVSHNNDVNIDLGGILKDTIIKNL